MLPPEDPEGVPDLGWVDSKTKHLRAESDKLEQQLKGYKNNLIKESIRVCIPVYVYLYRTASAASLKISISVPVITIYDLR